MALEGDRPRTGGLEGLRPGAITKLSQGSRAWGDGGFSCRVGGGFDLGALGWRVVAGRAFCHLSPRDEGCLLGARGAEPCLERLTQHRAHVCLAWPFNPGTCEGEAGWNSSWCLVLGGARETRVGTAKPVLRVQGGKAWLPLSPSEASGGLQAGVGGSRSTGECLSLPWVVVILNPSWRPLGCWHKEGALVGCPCSRLTGGRESGKPACRLPAGWGGGLGTGP